jgi:uncharacterized protein (DUF58 family)
VNVTARTFRLVALTMAVAIADVWTGDPTLHATWLAATASLLLAVAIEGFLLTRRPFELSLDVPPRLYLGRPTAARIVLDNRSAYPTTIEVLPVAPNGIDAPAVSLRMRAAARSVASTPLTLTSTHLGKMDWPDLPARVLGAFGLIWWTRRLHPRRAVEVAADVVGTPARRITNLDRGARAGRTRGSGAELYQLRNYHPGDALHRIDWKASARRDALIVREFTEDQHLDVVVVVDAGPSSRLAAGALDRLGVFANVAVRLAKHAIAADDRVGLVVYAERTLALVPPTRGRDAARRICDAFTAIDNGVGSSPLAAALALRTLARQRSLIVVLGDLDDAAPGSELARAVRLLQAKHFVVVAGVTTPDVESLAMQPADHWLDPYRSLAARERLSRTRAQIASLRRTGVPVLAARPSDLEATALDYYDRLRRERRV